MDKLTDNEIIKAFEICYTDDEEDCLNCPFCDEVGECMDGGDSELLEEVGYLINRQKDEIERLLKQLKEGIDLSDSVIRDVKSEAIKEFIEKLDERLTNYGIYSQYVKDTIKQIVKEMRSEENEFRKRN